MSSCIDTILLLKGHTPLESMFKYNIALPTKYHQTPVEVDMAGLARWRLQEDRLVSA